MKIFLIEFQYEYWSQGYYKTWTTALVYADSFDLACEKIKLEYRGAELFHNNTIR